jgi:succinate dehydrogenase/fumarate reductase flavoprotein subunit
MKKKVYGIVSISLIVLGYFVFKQKENNIKTDNIVIEEQSNNVFHNSSKDITKNDLVENLNPLEIQEDEEFENIPENPQEKEKKLKKLLEQVAQRNANRSVHEIQKEQKKLAEAKKRFEAIPAPEVVKKEKLKKQDTHGITWYKVTYSNGTVLYDFENNPNPNIMN